MTLFQMRYKKMNENMTNCKSSLIGCLLQLQEQYPNCTWIKESIDMNLPADVKQFASFVDVGTTCQLSYSAN